MFGKNSEAPLAVKDAPAGVLPTCPACKHDLELLWRMPLGPEHTMFGAKLGQQALMCPHCHALLAVV
jgi:glutaredoxin